MARQPWLLPPVSAWRANESANADLYGERVGLRKEVDAFDRRRASSSRTASLARVADEFQVRSVRSRSGGQRRRSLASGQAILVTGPMSPEFTSRVRYNAAMFGRAGLVFFAIWIAASHAAAATVSGVVSDSTGASVPNAVVVLHGLASGQESSVETGVDGRFSLDASSPGTYLVIITRSGFSGSPHPVVIAEPRAMWSICRCRSSSRVSALRPPLPPRGPTAEIRGIPLHVETPPRRSRRPDESRSPPATR